MDQDKTIILACSSLTEYVEAAQESVGTRMRVRYLNRIYHRDPAEMQEHIKTELSRMPEGIDTVLVCMGFCGGSSFVCNNRDTQSSTRGMTRR